MNPRLSIFIAIATMSMTVSCRETPAPAETPVTSAMDRDLMDVTVPRLRQLYADRKYTVTEVVRWHLDRIDRYNPIYGAIETVLRDQALEAAERQDAQSGGTPGPLCAS